MALLVFKNSAVSRLLSRHETFCLAVILSFPVVALDQFLHTSPAVIGASPAFQSLRWISDTLMALPLFAGGVWTGHLIADRMGLQPTVHSEIFGRALVISGSLAVFLIPGWFAYNKLASLTQSADLAAVHSHGVGLSRDPDAYWVSNAAVYALLFAPVAVAAGWAGYRLARRLAGRRPRAGRLLAWSPVIAVLLGGISAGAWFLHQAANRADSSQVYYTSALQFAHVHSHAFFARNPGAHLPPAGPPVTAAPFAFLYQVARAFQDGLIAQVIGLPVAALVLLWGASLLRDQVRPKHEGSNLEEVANR
jgi:hypothetical protein